MPLCGCAVSLHVQYHNVCRRGFPAVAVPGKPLRAAPWFFVCSVLKAYGGNEPHGLPVGPRMAVPRRRVPVTAAGLAGGDCLHPADRGLAALGVAPRLGHALRQRSGVVGDGDAFPWSRALQRRGQMGVCREGARQAAG